MRRLTIIAAVAAGTLAVGGALTLTEPAVADSGPTAGSMAVYPVPVAAVGGARVSCTDGLCGLLGSLVGPVLTELVNPLLGAVQTLPQDLIDPVTSALTSAGGLHADQPNPHSGGAPTPCAAPWSSDDCYTATGLNLPANTVLSLGLSAIAGYTETNTAPASQPATGAASTALTGLNLLGLPLVGGGLVTSESDCPTATGASATAHSTVGSLSLLGGLLTVNAADGSNALSVSGLAANLSMADPQGGTLPVTTSLNGNLLTITVELSTADLVHGLGLSLPLNPISAAVPLTVKIDTGRVTEGASSASAWGLRVRVSLGVHLALDVSGVATLAVDLDSSPLLDLRLAATNCTSGSGSSGTGGYVIPPALT